MINRDVVYLLSIASMPCGGCDSEILMSCNVALKHSRECLENQILCPLLNNDMVLSQCTQALSVSSLWEHCQQFHTNASSQAISYVTATPSEDGTMTAIMTAAMTFERNNYIFFTITTPKNKYNMCLHVTKDVGDANRHDPKISISVRRFFPETEMLFRRKILSIEVGTTCGMLLSIPSIVSSYEDFTSIKQMELPLRMQKIVEIPISLLSQMLPYDADDTENLGPMFSSSFTKLKMTLSLQLWFVEQTAPCAVQDAVQSALDP